MDIALGVDRAFESKQKRATDDYGTGAGDQGIIFGYAQGGPHQRTPGKSGVSAGKL